MIEVAKDTDLEQKINDVIEMAWGFGFDCCVDDITSMNEGGDSYIEFTRHNLEKAKDQLYAMILERMK